MTAEEVMAENVYRARRDRLIEQVDDGVLLVRGAGPDGVNASFYYLTGLEEPAGSLLLAPSGVRIETGRRFPGPGYVSGRLARQVLLLPAGDALAARWGEDAAATAGSTDAAEAGVDAVLEAGELDALLTAALADGPLHYVRAAAPSLAGSDDAAFVGRVRHHLFGARIVDATHRVHEMRRLKDDGEVDAIQRAIAVTGDALARVMHAARPGLHEYELEAELARVYRRHGGGHAFEPIVAAGSNANLLHYKKNTGLVREGELILIDTGARIDGYRADVTRTFPVDGRFTDRQREVYAAVLAAQDASIAACTAGALLAEIHATAYRTIDDAGFGESFIHGTSHHLGLEAQDVGDVHRPLEPGAVVTVEPGIYLRDEGIGVRIEDDVLVTAEGPRNLSKAIPRTVEEIERFLAVRSEK